MTPALRRCVHAAVLAAAATGLVLLWTRYVAPPGEESDPPAIDATAQHLHVLLVPLVVFAFGVLWPTHVLPHLRASDRLQVTGLLLLLVGLLMVATGYGLQVATDDLGSAVLGWAHAASGTAWLAIFAVHCVRARWGAPERVAAAAGIRDPTRRSPA
jgi:hypothetical protein